MLSEDRTNFNWLVYHNTALECLYLLTYKAIKIISGKIVMSGFWCRVVKVLFLIFVSDSSYTPVLTIGFSYLSQILHICQTPLCTSLNHWSWLSIYMSIYLSIYLRLFIYARLLCAPVLTIDLGYLSLCLSISDSSYIPDSSVHQS